MDVAVVGAGIHGLNCAWRLGDSGHRVVCFDPRAIGNSEGSSHGQSRIVRRAYPDAFHTRLMTEAYPLWRELEAASGVPLLHEVGLICFGPRDGEYVAGLAGALRSQDVPFTEMDGSGAKALLPQFTFGAEEGAVFVPEAGWVAADLALKAVHGLAESAGVEFVPAAAGDLQSFDRVVVCAGPWVRRFWPEAPVRVTLQATAMVSAESEGPVWIEDGPELLYGFPSAGARFKVGVHRPGPELSPEEADREPPTAMVSAIDGFARRRMGMQRPVLTEARGCLYTSTADERFLLHPLDDKTLIVSACSGHGFKFGPWIGVQVQRLIT